MEFLIRGGRAWHWPQFKVPEVAESSRSLGLVRTERPVTAEFQPRGSDSLGVHQLPDRSRRAGHIDNCLIFLIL